MQVEIITIGDEILIGQIIDTNSAWIAQQLNAIGIHVKQVSSVADYPADIIVALTLASGRADVVLVTGGLGPTKDDVTKQTLAAYFDCGLRRDAKVLAHVESIFARSARPMLEINRRQADVLDKCDVLFNEMGTAPGMWVSHKGKTYIIMPGVPFEMKHIMLERVIPRLKQFEDRKPLWHHTILTGGIGESYLAEKIADIEAALPHHIHLAYLPKPGIVRLRLSATGGDLNALKAETTTIVQQIKQRIGIHFLAGEDTSLEQLIRDFMQQRGLLLATAESCTGGNIAKLITALPGSSSMFEGSAVTYSNAMKMKLLDVKQETLDSHGAVSEQTVREMALGAQRNFKVDYAIAVSGIAGPDGGTPEKPVGLVWIAVAGKTQVAAHGYLFGHDRAINIDRSSMAALFMLWQLLNAEHK
ncbi:competence/damage-inducible protein A [Parapedobacter sp. ISTM3]|uniref:competence/damage-inducible protein A n=1 Tax=Parapedobacter sp. ISTM3 TaxID=2800130 RepID=UPI001907C7E8|nr:competence/damage-inducible protein A [Parapedobacter sp. ISTM3]MBK1441703.1 competence/damage-inducible protein A [Parapedobacter sp. ISTM3]